MSRKEMATRITSGHCSTILGVVTPYEAYLQNQLHIAPTVNSSVTRLLGTLFPSRQR